MAFRNIIIESPAQISLKNKQLIIKTDSEHSVAVEDISALLIESRASSITAAALSHLGQSGCAVFICDEKHLPCAVLEPFSQHSRALGVLKAQLEATEPLKKRLWQQIVISKIANQSAVLRLCGKDRAADALMRMSETVKSGDPDNVEALAAQRYFPALFDEGFSRGSESVVNSALNYGYAIIRGCAARCLAVYGLVPALGLHHKSTLNGFNLADDIMEPFRPLIDLLTYYLITEDDLELTPQLKRQLFNSLNLDIISGGQHHSASYAIERLVRSLSRSLFDGKAVLRLPEIIELGQHKYE